MAEEKGTSVTLGGDLSAPATKLIEKVAGAIGAVWEPHQIRRVGKAKAEARIEDARAGIVIAEMHELSSQNVIELGERTLKRLVSREVKRQINIENTLAIALEKLSAEASNQELDPSRVSDDVVSGIFDRASDVADDRLQELWAGLLVSEVAKPGTVSKSTMNAIASMDRSDAQLFEKFAAACAFLNGAAFSFTEDSVLRALERLGVGYVELSHLCTLGLLNYDPVAGMKIMLSPSKKMGFEVTFPKSRLEFVLEAGKYPINLGTYFLSKAGEELYQIANPMSSLDVEEEVLKQLQDQGIDARRASL